MKKIKDLFIEKEANTFEYTLNDRYHLWIEALDYNGNSLIDDGFWLGDIGGVLIELYDRKIKDTIAEYNDLFHPECELVTLESIMQSAIQTYEQNQGDIYTVYIYDDEYGDKLAFTEDFFDEKEAIRYADKFVDYYDRVEVLDPNGEKIY